MTTLAFDIETDGLLDVCTRIWVLCVGDVDTGEITRYTDYDPDYPTLSEGLARIAAADTIVAHNGIGFDVKAIRKIAGTSLDYSRLIDTLVVGRLADPERRNGHSLESYGVELGEYKGSHSDWSCYSEEMGRYCEQDVRVTIKLFKKLKPVIDTWGESVALEHAVAYLIDLQMDNGFTLDVRGAMALAAEISDQRNAVVMELQRVFPPIYVPAGTFVPKKDDRTKGYTKGVPFTKITLQEFNPASTHHVAVRLKRLHGWDAPLTEAGNPNVDEAVLKKLTFPEVEPLLRFARLNKLYTQVAGPPKKDGSGGGWLHQVKDDGRVHGYVNPNGAVTGRMTHSRPNTANIDKDPRARALWIPRQGWKLVGIDAEGLELRMLAHYLWRYDNGEFARALLDGDKAKGTDAHSRNRDLASLASRDGAKTTIYGLIYGAGDPKLGEIWLADWQASGKPQSEWPSWAFTVRGTVRRLRPVKQIGAEVRSRLESGITGFGELVAGVKKAAKERGWLRGLDGRKTYVRSQHSALNTLLQGGGAIVMKKALVLLHQDLTGALKHGVDFAYCANVHDEWQIEARPDIAQQIGEMGKRAITKAGEALGVRCRLDGAFDVGDNWYETH